MIYGESLKMIYGESLKMSRRLLFAVMLGVIAGSSAIAREWHGIIPLHSTRSDVLRILGKPNTKYDRYLIDGEEASIIYSRSGPCSNGWNVPSDTVTIISVTFKQSIKLSDLKIDLNKYERVRDPLVTTHVFYTNKEEGVRYEVFEGIKEEGTVLEVNYVQTWNDEILFRCEKKTITFEVIQESKPEQESKPGSGLQFCNSLSQLPRTFLYSRPTESMQVSCVDEDL